MFALPRTDFRGRELFAGRVPGDLEHKKKSVFALPQTQKEKRVDLRALINQVFSEKAAVFGRLGTYDNDDFRGCEPVKTASVWLYKANWRWLKNVML